MHEWQWQRWEGLPYLTCSLLRDWQHGFFTQHFWSRTPEELVDVFSPSTAVYRLKQVHGNRVLMPSEIPQTEGELASGDGMMTEEPDQSVWVASADCTPVLIADRATGRVAAIHAGWRGTAQQIVPTAIARFLQFGTQKSDLCIALGPAIAGEVYQVSTEVAIEVGQTILPSEPSRSPDGTLAALEQLPHPPILSDPHPNRVRLDVRRVNALQIEQLGISAEQVALAPHCTYQQPDNFFSYRRTQEKKVQWSGIISNP
ncbi:peptidoglycan editing factor PgeF [Lusitaniella coriacea]|uniref:peptidoglycan editing factor PgeF n=1 Tax=Lusitaniella coriacea TaxID=1983105 RepID=UPI003CECFA4D